MTGKNSSYTSTVSHFTKNGDAVVILPDEMCKKYGYRPGDSFYYTEVDMKIVMTPIIRLSRLKREWNKYMRRMEKFEVSFIVMQANKIIGKLTQSDSKYHIKQFEMK